MQTQLRPLNLGEILDRTFQMYRSYFQTFTGIALVGAVCTLVWRTIYTLTGRAFALHHAVTEIVIVNAVGQLVFYGVYLVSFSVVFGAMVHVVAAIYRGQPVGAVLALRTVKPRWLVLARTTVTASVLAWGLVAIALIGLTLIIPFARRVQTLAGANAVTIAQAGIGLSFLVLFPLGIWLSLRYAFANAACAYEDIKVVRSLQRSVALGQGVRLKMLVLLIVAGIVQAIVALILSAPLWTILRRGTAYQPLWAVIYELVATFLVSVVATPIYGIGIALFYFDARIRKEGLDIEWSLQNADVPGDGFVPEPISTTQFPSLG